MSRISAVLVAAGLLLAGCGAASSSSSSPAPGGGSGGGGGTSATLFPVAVGNTWVYDDTIAGHAGGTTTNMMTSVTPDSGGQKVTIKTHSDITGLPTSATTLTYQFNSDGSIAVPYAQVGNNAVTIKSGGIVWPPRARLDSGQPHTSALSLQIKVSGHTVDVQAHVTVQGGGTQSVTVPAGTYTATVVVEKISEHFAGADVTIEVKTWLANGVGPVKSVASTNSGSVSEVVSAEVLKSFTKG